MALPFNVVVVPAHIAVVPEAIAIVGVTTGFTVIVILFEVAVAGLLQFAFDVMTTRTTSLLFKVVEVKVGESVPTFVPFTFH